MMNAMPQVVSVSELKAHHQKVFDLLDNGPIILAQHSKAAAVLVSVEEWERQTKRLQELEWHEEIQRAAKAARASTEPDLNHEEFMAELSAYHADA
jgi:prevent-host-death family protein